jgi:Ca2+-binding RTX toxin-like protein
MSPLPRLTLLVAAVAALAAMPTPALAGTVGVSGTSVTYRAAPGETNDVTVTATKTAVTVKDAGAPVSGCTAVDPNTTRCDGTFRRASLTLGSGADRARITGIAASVNGGSGPDRLTGGVRDDLLDGAAGNDVLDGGAGDDLLLGDGGNDTLRGGRGRDELDGDVGDDLLVGGPAKDRVFGFRGRDRIDSADGVVETVDCGTETDFARIDLRDRIQFCEHRDRVRSDTPAGR